jgi:hypothetical protein
MKNAIRFGFLPFLFFLLITSATGYAQNRKLDSLKHQVAISKSDSAASMNLWWIAKTFSDQKGAGDSTMFYALQGYALAKKNGFLMGMYVNLAEQCYTYQRSGNYQKALRMYLDFLKLCEEKKNIKITIRVLSLISNLYIKLEDYGTAIAYAKKNTPVIIASQIGGGWLTGNLYIIGLAYIHLHQPDSALTYFQQGFALASRNLTPQQHSGSRDQMLVGLGMANRQLGNNNIALAYFDEAIRNEKEYDNEDLYFAYLQKAELFGELKKADSSAVYYQQALRVVSGSFNDQVRIYAALANIYAAKDPARSVRYFEAEQKLRDSLFASDKLNAIQALTYNEQERQKELELAQKTEEEAHKQNIENTLIAIGIIGFLTLFLLLSRSVIVNEKWIRFLGIVGLLVLFEFINLLIHPLLEKFTNHSSIYMLLIMVGIAALLVPMHHRIEKWITGRMVEKNKQIRMAAARKTIEKLSDKKDIS